MVPISPLRRARDKRPVRAGLATRSRRAVEGSETMIRPSLCPTAEAEDARLAEGDQEDQHGEDEGAGRAASVVKVGDRHLVEVDQRWSGERDVAGRRLRATHDVVELVKGLEGGNDAEHEDGDRSVAQPR